MSFIVAPLTFVISMFLLLAGGFCLFDAQGTGELAQHLLPCPVNSAATGIALVLVGAFNLFGSLGMTGTDSGAVARSTSSISPATNVYADLSAAKSLGLDKSPEPTGVPPDPNGKLRS